MTDVTLTPEQLENAVIKYQELYRNNIIKFNRVFLETCIADESMTDTERLTLMKDFMVAQEDTKCRGKQTWDACSADIRYQCVQAVRSILNTNAAALEAEASAARDNLATMATVTPAVLEDPVDPEDDPVSEPEGDPEGDPEGAPEP